jgi:peptide/nickel transport system permease protein
MTTLDSTPGILPTVRRKPGFWRTFARSPLAVVCLAILVLLILVAIFAPVIAMQNPYDLSVVKLRDSLRPPMSAMMSGRTAWLGTDGAGRDLLSAIMYGLRVSLLVGLSSAAIALSIGTVIGLLSGYFGGRIDAIIMRVVDLQLSFPAMLIALLLIASLGRGLENVILALVMVQWAYYARAARASALVERQKEYVEADHSLVIPQLRIIFRHVLPNCLSPLVVIATLQTAHAILLEATLSFLGVGLPTTQPSLGLLVANGYNYMLSHKYWVSFFPGLALMVMVLTINIVGDRLREMFDPRSA